MDRMKTSSGRGMDHALTMVSKRCQVFDTMSKLDVEPYLGAGEFLLEYGNFDYKYVPYDHIV